MIYTLGQINFLTDRSATPHLSTADLAAYFGVGQSTVQGKGKTVRQALGATRMSAQWILPSRARRDPLVWMIAVNGLIVDVRRMPREVQETALARGAITFIPDAPESDG